MTTNRSMMITFVILLVLSFMTVVAAAEYREHNVKPAAGYVPDEETAIKIAVAVWTPIYGREKIEREKPYTAVLENGIWHISGSLHKGRDGGRVVGGVAEVEIDKTDGRIIRISHGK